MLGGVSGSIHIHAFQSLVLMLSCTTEDVTHLFTSQVTQQGFLNYNVINY